MPRQDLSFNAQRELDRYFRLKVGRHEVPCPYFMNVRMLPNLTAVYAGKGTPDEIEEEVERLLRRRGTKLASGDTNNKSQQDAEDFLILCGIGIDCSGLVVNVLNQHLKETVGKTIPQVVKHKNILDEVYALFRPRTTFSANLITSPLNSVQVDLKDVEPGDLLRQGKKHLLLVEWTERKGGQLNKLGYVESNTRPGWGVQRGEIVITNQNGLLEDQKWLVPEAQGRYQRTEDRGIRRLRRK